MAKIINANIIGTPTDAPFVQCDNGHVYVGILNEARMAFRLQNSDTGGADLRYLDKSFRFIIPLEPGSYEAGNLGLPDIAYDAPAAPIIPVRVDGQCFVTDAGPWIWKGSSDFLLYNRYLDEEDIDDLLQQRRLAGANLVRVFGMVPYPPVFNPAKYGGRYYADLPLFAQHLASWGLYLEFTVFAGAQDFPQIPQQAHFIDCCTMLRGQPNVFIELCNEYPKNGIKPEHFTKPVGLLASAGSSLSDAAPDVYWDFFGWHGRRDWPKLSNVEDMLETMDEHRLPGVHDEPVGAAEFDQPGRRTTSVLAMRTIASNSARLGSGATFHSEAGLRSERWGPIQERLARVFFEAMGN